MNGDTKIQSPLIKSPLIKGDVFFFAYAPVETFASFDEVYVWDLDKTYLDSSWGSLKELWRTAVEKAFQKKNIPGTASLVMALRMSWTESEGHNQFPLFFITASPPQMEPKIKEKWVLDEIVPLASFFRDNLKNISPKRFRRLTQQVGYKLQALLELRLALKPDVRQLLWGDDSESDAIIYSLYSDLCSRRLSEGELGFILKSLKVGTEQLDHIFELQARIPSRDPVERIYINLATDTDPEYYLKFGRRILPTYNSFQAALDLARLSRLNGEQVVRVGLDMIINYGFTSEELTLSFDDLIRRHVLDLSIVEALTPLLILHNIIPADYVPSIKPHILSENQDDTCTAHLEPWIPEHIDYLHDFR